MGRLDGKTAIITGAARGMGEAAARRFAAEGANVLMTDVLADLGAEVASEIGGNVEFAEHDVSDRARWDRVVAHAERRFGSVDILINNAGISGNGSTLELETEDSYTSLVATNQSGVFHGMRAVIAPMKRAGGGSIVNVSSIAGLVAWPGLGSYSATKFAVVGLTKTGAAELGRYGIRVNCIHPGVTDTPMARAVSEEFRGPSDAIIARLPIARLGRPDELAAAMLFFASADSSYCTGVSLPVDGGWTTV